MKLDLKSREYDNLCEEFEKVKEENINPNDKGLLNLKDKFIRNKEEIVELNKRLIDLKKQIEEEDIQQLQKYDSEKMFKKDTKENKENRNELKEMIKVEKNKNIFQKIIQKIKSIFNMKEN